MSRDKNTGEKTTSFKAFRKLNKAVDAAIRAQDASPSGRAPRKMVDRHDSTFAALHKASARHAGRGGKEKT